VRFVLDCIHKQMSKR